MHPDAADDDGDDTNNPRTRTEYDALGRKTAEIDEAGRTTRYAYDPLGCLVAVVLPDPVPGDNPPLVNGESPSATTLVTRYGYDEVGNKTTQTTTRAASRARNRSCFAGDSDQCLDRMALT